MKHDDVLALMNEPACAHNKKSKSGCAKPAPGATQGGCCFDGARNALLPIADVAHIVHGPIGCAGSSWDNRGTRSSGADTYRIGMTTDLTDMDVIMGRGEMRLFRSIRQTVETHKPAAVFVYNTCVPALQGDDIEAVAKKASVKFGVPVVAVDCAGFYGNKNLGNRIAGDAIYKHVIGTREPDAAPEQPGLRTHHINLIGEWNVGGEFWNVAPLFDELGLRIICTFSGDARFREVQAMHCAEANMVVCSKAMLHVARKLEADHGIPWFEGSFYGIADTSQAFRDIARLIGDDDLTARTEALIAREEAKVAAALVPIRERLAGKRVLIFTGGYKSWSVVSAMQDLGMIVVATGTEKSTEEDKARILTLMGPDALMIPDNDQTALIRTFHEREADIMIAGDRYIYPALKSRIPFLDIDHVRRIGYAGYDGMIELARNIGHAVHSPVWDQVSRRPSWQAAA
jgi:nitrogenase molybdenum-iron cofactor biosynthesis protein NifE